MLPTQKEELFERLKEEGVESFNRYRQETEFELIDLSGMDFTGMDLSGINLSQANMHGCILDLCLLNDATLVFTQFNRSSMRETMLHNAHAAEADFAECDLLRANFNAAELVEARFECADAKEAEFTDASLKGANFKKAYLNDANFHGADVSGADFSDAEMEWSILTGVRFSEKTRWSNQKPPVGPNEKPLLS